MPVKFLIKGKDDLEIELSIDNTILDLKREIINKYKLKCNAIDVYVDLEVPLRGMGKYTLEKGIIQRAMDNYPLNKFNVENKSLMYYGLVKYCILIIKLNVKV